MSFIKTTPYCQYKWQYTWQFKQQHSATDCSYPHTAYRWLYM